MRRIFLPTTAVLMAVTVSTVLWPAAASGAAPRSDEPVYLSLDGEPVRLSDRGGDVVLLTWWATWCGACRKKMPDVVALHEELGPRGLRVIGASVNGRNEAALVRRAMADLGVDFEVWLWANANDMARYGLGPELPASILVDRDGRIVERIRGPLDVGRLRRIVAPLLSADAAPGSGGARDGAEADGAAAP